MYVTFFFVLVTVMSLSVTVTATGGLPGGVGLHPQYQRHETTQDPAQHTDKPLRYAPDVKKTYTVYLYKPDKVCKLILVDPNYVISDNTYGNK